VKKLFIKTLQVLAVLYFFIAVSCKGVEPAEIMLSVAEMPGSFTPAQHLVFIGLDGWGGAFMSRANMPTVKRMMAQGVSSLNIRCIMPSISWPNWSALFSGASPEDQNIDPFPTIFTLVNEQRSRPALFYEWNDLQNICSDETAEKIRILSDLESAQRAAVYIMENKPVFTAVVFNEPDSVGHNKGWGTRAYYTKLNELDSYMAIIEQAVKDAGIYDNTVFVLSSDHGGLLWGHGFNMVSHRRIPLVVYGSIIREGFVIPGSGSICDIAPTMAAILGLDIPGEWTGRPILGVFK